MGHQHSIIDSDTHFLINPQTMAITNASTSSTIKPLKRGDHAAERYTFEMPRYVEGHDMSLCNKVEIHYNNIKYDSGTRKTTQNSGFDEAEDFGIDSTSEDTVVWSWLTKQANEELRLYNATMRINRLEMLKANIGLELISGHEELEKFMGEILQGRTMDELERQAGILGKTVLNNVKKADAIVNGSFKVAKVGNQSTFSDRIWQYQDLMREDLGKLLQQRLIQGKNPRAIAKDLSSGFHYHVKIGIQESGKRTILLNLFVLQVHLGYGKITAYLKRR